MKTERKLRIFEDAAYISLDLQQKILTLIRKRDGAPQPGQLPVSIEEANLEQGDALKSEIESFLDCIRNDRRPIVSGEDGLRALETAIRITEQVHANLRQNSNHRLEGAARRTYICRMNTLIRPLNDVRRTLDIDLVADFTCPWSWLGMAQLTRALGNLSGDVETRLRWHPFRMASPRRRTRRRAASTTISPSACRPGISVPFAEKSLTEAGRELGIEFHFEKLGASAEHLGGASPGAAGGRMRAVMRTWRPPSSARISNAAPTSATSRCWRGIGAEAGLGEKTLQAFRETREGDAALVGSEERLRGFGVRTVPNLLFGGRVLVPGTVNVATYVHALDQALFPVERRGKRRKSRRCIDRLRAPFWRLPAEALP